MTEGEQSSSPRRLSNKRLTGACKGCHSRKVRCDLGRSGQPCTNCSLDEIQCEPRTRKRYKATVPKRIKPRQKSSPPINDPANESTAQSLADPVPITQDGEVLPNFTDQSDTHSSLLGHAAGSSQFAHPHEAVNRSSISRSVFRSHISHYEEPGTEDFTHVSKETPLYGDPRGIALVLNICEASPKDRSGHILVPDSKAKVLAPEDLDYLRLKGVFSWPEKSVCDQLIRTYFHYVHPFFPILEAKTVLPAYENGEMQKFGIHLLWSIFFVASHYSDQGVVQRAGFSSRKEMRQSLYKKAKVLYDMQYEGDRITFIQCVLLMGFWYCDTVDSNGPWHWTGVAISLCQTAGLHRQPDSQTRARVHGRHLLWRHIWWACVHRDALYSMGLGRPMRINLDDCDLDLPDASDYIGLLADIPENIQQKYLPIATEKLAHLWVELLRLTAIQAQILSKHYRVKPALSTDSAGPLETESQIEKSVIILGPLKNTTCDIVYYHVCHLRLLARSILVALYRPYLLESSLPDQVHLSPEWRSNTRRKARTAATEFNQTLSALIAADMIRYCQSIVCVTLVPPMQVHLVDSTSKDFLIHSMGINNLELCMLVVKEIRNTWFGAEVVHRMFRQARLLIEKRASHQRDEHRESMEVGHVESMIGVLPGDSGAAGESDPLFGFGYPYTGLEGLLNTDDLGILEVGFDINSVL